jgi:hypothetical protein
MHNRARKVLDSDVGPDEDALEVETLALPTPAV